MALRRIYKKRFKGVTWKSGHFYDFKYQAYENDPKPTVIFMYFFQGTHQHTGRQWRFFQAINLSYVPRAIRRRFVRDWSAQMTKRPDVKFTWMKVKSRYPQIQNAVRRYFYDPAYYISGAKEIPMDDVETIVVSTWSKDFSRKVKNVFLSKLKRIRKNVAQFKRTGKFPRRR